MSPSTRRFAPRLTHHCRLYKEHSAILQRKEDRTANAEKDLFKPQIERSPLNARNVDNLPIHEHLTEQNKKRVEKHRVKIKEKERKEDERRNFKVKSERTQNLLRRMKKSSCEEVRRSEERSDELTTQS